MTYNRPIESFKQYVEAHQDCSYSRDDPIHTQAIHTIAQNISQLGFEGTPEIYKNVALKIGNNTGLLGELDLVVLYPNDVWLVEVKVRREQNRPLGRIRKVANEQLAKAHAFIKETFDFSPKCMAATHKSESSVPSPYCLLPSPQ